MKRYNQELSHAVLITRIFFLIQNQILYTNASIISQPIIVDLDADGYKDLLVCSLSGEVIAYSGALPHKILWQYVRPQSQCSRCEILCVYFSNSSSYRFLRFSLMLSGSFENDTCPDIIVTFNVGDGFPNYKFFEVKHFNIVFNIPHQVFGVFQTILLKGKTGIESKRLFTSTLPVDPRVTSIKMNGVGNDIILGFNFGCVSGLPKYLDAGFSSLSGKLRTFYTVCDAFVQKFCSLLILFFDIDI